MSNFTLPEPEIKAKATSGTNEATVLQRLRALGELPKTDKNEAERLFLRRVLKQIRRA